MSCRWPHRCIAIDDSVFGVEAARRAGMYVLAYAAHGNGERLPSGDRIRLLHDIADLPDVVGRLVSAGRSGLRGASHGVGEP